MIAPTACSARIGAGLNPTSGPKYEARCRASRGSMPRPVWQSSAPTSQADAGPSVTVLFWLWMRWIWATVSSTARSAVRTVERPSRGGRDAMAKQAKNTICLWYDRDAEEAARFYAKTFPDSSVGAVHRAPGDFPSGKQGDVLTVEFNVMGVPCLGLNGGPAFKHNEAFSFQVATVDQAETDRYWNAIVGNGGQE